MSFPFKYSCATGYCRPSDTGEYTDPFCKNNCPMPPVGPVVTTGNSHIFAITLIVVIIIVIVMFAVIFWIIKRNGGF